MSNKCKHSTTLHENTTWVCYGCCREGIAPDVIGVPFQWDNRECICKFCNVKMTIMAFEIDTWYMMCICEHKEKIGDVLGKLSPNPWFHVSAEFQASHDLVWDGERYKFAPKNTPAL